MKSNKGNGVAISDQKLYNNAIQEITSDTSKFEKLNKDANLKREAFFVFYVCYNIFYVSWKKNKFCNENEYEILYPSGSVLAHIYGTPKIHKFSSIDSFPKLCPIVSSIRTSNYNLAHFLFNLLPPLVPSDYSCKDFYFVSQIKNENLSR